MTLIMTEQAELSLRRLLPRIESVLVDTVERKPFLDRLSKHFPRFFELYYQLYDSQYDFFYHLEQVLLATAEMYAARPDTLKSLDQERERNPLWFQSEQMLGAVCYVDLFAGTLNGIRERIPYFRDLRLTYLHLMPLFSTPELHNDGGYAVSSFREVNPSLGSMQELAALAQELRDNGISLVLDFVFNHTSDEHEWARKALAGEKEYQNYYRMFDDRTLPDLYEPHLREIFPQQAPGSFTFRPEIQKWVWTTFYPFQWDLNYANPALFCAMLREMLFLANQGVEVLRLDAVPFIWKQLGTNSENLPAAHLLIQAYNALVRIAAPSLLFKSEAIVHPRDVRSYISRDECQLSYNPIMMVSIWEALATREVTFFTHAMQKQFTLPADCSWLNYVRSHDDIGWGFADEDAAEAGINGFDHRYFLNLFYTGRFPGSFASGLPFNYNPHTQDMRISGTTASLAGLEQALNLQNDLYIENAIRRTLLIHSVILTAGGIPLIYLGDEVGTLNDYVYEKDPATADDSRWVHRPFANEKLYAERSDPATISGRIYTELKHLIEIRRCNPVLSNGSTRFFHTGNKHVLGYVRHNQLLVLANFSDFEQEVAVEDIRGDFPQVRQTKDLITECQVDSTSTAVRLEPYQFMWLMSSLSSPAE